MDATFGTIRSGVRGFREFGVRTRGLFNQSGHILCRHLGFQMKTRVLGFWVRRGLSGSLKCVNKITDCEKADKRRVKTVVFARDGRPDHEMPVPGQFLGSFCCSATRKEYLLNCVFERKSPQRKFLSFVCVCGDSFRKTRGKVTSLWRGVFSVWWEVAMFLFFLYCFQLELHM